jgi:hypothetical protein
MQHESGILAQEFVRDALNPAILGEDPHLSDERTDSLISDEDVDPTT